jgi:hypothetical protein
MTLQTRKGGAADSGSAAPPVPGRTEEGEQRCLFDWVGLAQRQRPELRMLFAVPNGGARHKAVAAKLKAGGVRAGVPDLNLAVARGGFHGLFIEMKVGKNTPSKDQRWWIAKLREAGYRVEVCYGFEAARDVILDYLRQKPCAK